MVVSSSQIGEGPIPPCSSINQYAPRQFRHRGDCFDDNPPSPCLGDCFGACFHCIGEFGGQAADQGGRLVLPFRYSPSPCDENRQSLRGRRALDVGRNGGSHFVVVLVRRRVSLQRPESEYGQELAGVLDLHPATERSGKRRPRVAAAGHADPVASIQALHRLRPHPHRRCSCDLDSIGGETRAASRSRGRADFARGTGACPGAGLDPGRCPRFGKWCWTARRTNEVAGQQPPAVPLAESLLRWPRTARGRRVCPQPVPHRLFHVGFGRVAGAEISC